MFERENISKSDFIDVSRGMGRSIVAIVVGLNELGCDTMRDDCLERLKCGSDVDGSVRTEALNVDDWWTLPMEDK